MRHKGTFTLVICQDHARGRGSLPQCKSKQTISCRYRYVLFPIHRKAYRSVRDLTAKHRLPKEFAVSGIEGVEIALTAARKDQVGRGGQDAAIGDLRHLICPLDVTRVRI